MAVGLKLTNEHNKKQVSRFFNIMRSKGCILSVVLLLISVTLFTITNKDKAYADIKCYSSDELTPGECVSSIISVGKTVSARDGSTFTIQDNKCYAYGDLSAGDLSIKEIVCPTREVSDEPTCYTGVGITIDCSDVPEELAGEEWRKPSFENGKCYREVSMDEWLRAAGIEDFPSNKIIGTVWTEASCSDLGATLEEKDCISDSLCNDVITKAKEEAAAATSDETPAEPEDTELNCEKSLTGPGWLICSVIEYSIDGIEALEEVIQGQLRFDLDNISGSATGGGEAEIRRGNGSITVVANTAFAIGILWIVLSQAISGGAGGGFFGAYEAKKILPKLIAGVIVANFSWDLANLMLKISNSLGDATKSIMLTPFGGNITIDIDNVDSWALLLGGVGTGLAVFFGFFALTPILLAAALAILIGYFALVFRKAVIIALVTFAPIALVISPFAPNITKRWMNMLRNMIFMYPIIMAMISAFAIMAHLLNIQAKATTGIPGMALRLAAIASLFAPYFMIVTLFKLMGDILGKLAGSAKALTDSSSKKWGQKRLEGNKRRVTRDDKRQEKIGLKKLEARRKRYGKIERQEERSKAYQEQYEAELASMNKTSSTASNSEKIKAAAVARSKMKGIRKGYNQLSPEMLRDKFTGGRLNPKDKKARDQYRAQLATKNWDEEHKLAADDLALRTASMSHLEAVEVAKQQAMYGATDHERRAGSDMLVKRRAGNALREVQEHNAADPNRRGEMNSFIGANYAELQSIDQGLTKMPGLAPEQQHLKAVNTYDPATGVVTGTEDMSTVPILQARINQSAANLVQSKPEDLKAHIAAVREVRSKADQIKKALSQGQFGVAGTPEYKEAQKMVTSLEDSHIAATDTINQVQAALTDPSSSLSSAAKTDAVAEIKTW
jgi:hypothetical protein